MIELKNVCYAYGNEIALRYINLNIQKGESVIISKSRRIRSLLLSALADVVNLH